MKTIKAFTTAALAGAMNLVSGAFAIDLISNGGFEAGFTSWTRAEQIGSAGTFADQTGTLSPVNSLAMPAPTQGLHAAMSDAAGPGSRVLYQDFLIPAGSTQGTIQFSYCVNNTAAAFTTPATLDFATPALNQQARVDIMSSSANAFSTAPADVLQSIFQTAVGSALITGYNVVSVDISSLLLAHGGETLRLRFAAVDNVNIMAFGVDAVSLNVIPAPPMLAIGFGAAVMLRRSRR